MTQKDSSSLQSRFRSSYKALKAACVVGACGLVVVSACNNGSSDASKKGDSTTTKKSGSATAQTTQDTTVAPIAPTGPVDTALYNKLMKHLANGDSSGRWPVKTA